MRSLHVLREIVCISKCRCREAFGKEDIRVDSINHVKHRAARSLLHHSLWLNKDGTPFPGRVGMKIRIHSTAPISDINRFHDSVQVKLYNGIYRREQCTFFECNIHSTFHVQNSPDRGVFISDGYPIDPIERILTDAESFIKFYDSCVELLHSLCTLDYHTDDGYNESGEVEETRR